MIRRAAGVSTRVIHQRIFCLRDKVQGWHLTTVDGPLIVIVAVALAPADTATESLTSDCAEPAVSVALQQTEEALVLK